MKTGLLIICFCISLSGCKNNNKVPGDILPPSKMQAVLWDMMRADKFLADFVLSRDSGLNKETESIKMYEQVFAIHSITKEKFRQSFSWYESHPSFLQVIMDSISNRPVTAPTKLVQPGDTVRQPVSTPSLADTSKAARKKIISRVE
ncbi:MAG: DUF4296 domain-containing protein [Chitinophagaceae bacterium]